MIRLLLALIANLPLITSAKIYKWASPQATSQGVRTEPSCFPLRLPHRQTKPSLITLRGAPLASRPVTLPLRNGISFVEYDIEKNQNARRAYDAIGGNAVLVILVGNKRLSAFTVVELKNIYP